MSSEIVKEGIPGKFDYLDHMSDIYVVAYGDNIVELLENAGLALFDSMTNIELIKPVETRYVSAEGYDLENLLYKWLEELLILYYSENIMCSEVIVDEFKITRMGSELNYSVKGRCNGEKFNPERHEARVEVKAVTYHLMKIVKTEDKWKAYFLLDI